MLYTENIEMLLFNHEIFVFLQIQLQPKLDAFTSLYCRELFEEFSKYPEVAESGETSAQLGCYGVGKYML